MSRLLEEPDRRTAALTIAGSDSSGGAGVQADLKTFAAHGIYGLTAVTAVTAQTSQDVTATHVVPAEIVAAQIEAAFAQTPIAAGKTGMLAGAATVRVVATLVARHRLRLVVDPVLASTGGRALLDEAAVDLLMTELLPLAEAVTPNGPEAERLSGMTIATPADVREAARRIRRLGPRAVIITGGHLARGSDPVVDLVDDGGAVVELTTPRVGRAGDDGAHGTGCTYSAALTAGLAAGQPLVEAARAAQRYVADTLGGPRPLGRHSRLLAHRPRR